MNQFGFTYNKIKLTVMGLIDKIVNKTKEPDHSLSKEELEFVLLAMKRATFTGEQLETVFNIVIKLQNQYQKYN
jgi:hypothetical protein